MILPYLSLHRTCYYTTASLNRKSDFISQLSNSFGSGGLSCSFSDAKLSQYMSWKQEKFHKSHSSFMQKQGVTQLGKQPCGNIWVLSEDCFLNRNGEYESHDYVWLKNISSFGTGKEISLEVISCDITQPITTEHFKPMLTNLRTCLQHNFYSAILLMGAGIMCFHYRKLIEMMRFCPQVMAIGPPSTGKTISLQASLSLFGANNCKNLYNSCSKAYCLQRSSISTIPFGIDDPNLPTDIGDLIICLYNGTLSANVCQGGLQPLSCPIYCTNFTFGNNER